MRSAKVLTTRSFIIFAQNRAGDREQEEEKRALGATAVGVVVAFTFEIVSISSSRTNFWFSLANLAQISSFFNS